MHHHVISMTRTFSPLVWSLPITGYNMRAHLVVSAYLERTDASLQLPAWVKDTVGLYLPAAKADKNAEVMWEFVADYRNFWPINGEREREDRMIADCCYCVYLFMLLGFWILPGKARKPHHISWVWLWKTQGWGLTLIFPEYETSDQSLKLHGSRIFHL